MKKLLLICVLLLSTRFTFSQMVENITTTQIGDQVSIQYEIKNSSSNQLFNVIISCSMNGEEKKRLDHVVGDVGMNIPGGQLKYTILWDVLKEINELRSADFYIGIEEIKTQSSKTGKQLNPNSPPILETKKIFLSYNMGLLYTPLGLRFGSVNNKLGAYSAFRFGPGAPSSENIDSIHIEGRYSILLGVTRKLNSNEKSSLVGFLGAGYANWGEKLEATRMVSTGTESGIEMELGLVLFRKKMVYTFGTNLKIAKTPFFDVTLGIGFNF